MYVIVTNDLNWHRENLLSNREKTGNLKMQFERVPCGKQAGGGGELCNNVQITRVYNVVPLFAGLDTALSKPLSLSSSL